jgi:hypothetical protein
MTVEQLRRMHQARPFQQFTLHMADGRQIHVDHPEFLAVFPSGRTIVVTQPDESFDIIDLLLVTSIQVANGRKRTRRR